MAKMKVTKARSNSTRKVKTTSEKTEPVKNQKSKRRSSTAAVVFTRKIGDKKYLKVRPDDVLVTIVTKKLVQPPRAKPQNSLQDQFRYPSSTKYVAKVLTGTIDGKMNTSGSAWVHVEDDKGSLVWTREFYKDNVKNLFDRLLPYSQIAKNIANYRPPGMKLVKISVTEHEWQAPSGKRTIPFNMEDYFGELSEKDKQFVIENEKKRDRWLTTTQPLVEKGKMRRQPDIQSKWKPKEGEPVVR